jgi:hypothetical protein
MFDDLKVVLLGQFGKSKWQSNFELLRLPLDMQGFKPSILMGKLKQSLQHGVNPENDLFLAMFLIRLPPSMREVVGSGNYKMAAAMVRVANTFCDARDTTHGRGCRNSPQQEPLLLGGSGVTRGSALPVQKVAPLLTKIFSVFKTLAIACASITIISMQWPTSV